VETQFVKSISELQHQLNSIVARIELCQQLKKDSCEVDDVKLINTLVSNFNLIRDELKESSELWDTGNHALKKFLNKLSTTELPTLSDPGNMEVDKKKNEIFNCEIEEKLNQPMLPNQSGEEKLVYEAASHGELCLSHNHSSQKKSRTERILEQKKKKLKEQRNQTERNTKMVLIAELENALKARNTQYI